jgi:RNA polymerase primary sigma factor
MYFGNGKEEIESYFNKIEHYKLLSKEEEEEIFNKEKLNENDKEKLILGNLKFVIQEAFKFRHEQIDVMDLIQAGNLGLLDAVEKYDHKKRISFIGFAKFDIRNRMIRALQIFSLGKNIRIPDQTRLKISKIKKIKENYKKEYGKDITLQEISDITGMTVSNINKLCHHIDPYTASIDVLVDNCYSEPSVENKEIKESINDIILSEIDGYGLTTLEKEIIIKRFIKGIEISEIVKHNNCSKEWIRKNQKNAIKKLKNSEILRDMFSDLVKI